MDALFIIIFLGAAQGIFLGLILITLNRGNQQANRVLGLLMILISVNLLYIIIQAEGIYQQIPHLLLLNVPLLFLYGPLILLYVLYLTRPGFSLKPLHAFHLLPFMAAAVYFAVAFYFHPGDEKIKMFQARTQSITFEDYFWSLSTIVYNLVYLILAVFALQKHKKRIQQVFSNTEKINLQWLQFLLLGVIGLFVLNSLFDILYLMGVTGELGLTVMAVAGTILIYMIGYRGLVQPEIFTFEEPVPRADEETSSGFTVEKFERLSSRIEQLMEREKPYLDPSLTIKDLANQADIPDYKLSSVINDHFDKNFFEFVNRYRIEEAKQRLQDPDYENFTILAIANDVGFNSKSSFNTAFKRFTQMTPSQFRNARN
jgi:AraC-like DNA-binding protein